MTGTYQRHKTQGNGLLNPLEDRMTDKQFERRTAKTARRIGQDHARTRGAFVQFVSMGFWARLRWLLKGAK